jgi:tetratricopeptide (TPR) repeat protein
MEGSVFDVFHAVKDLTYLGNYQAAYDEANSMDIDDKDLSQIIKRYFYIFINAVEDQKTEELNEFLNSFKEITDDQVKKYYNIFLFLTVYIFSNKFNEQKFSKVVTDLKAIKKYDPTLFPAVYVISLMLLDRNEYESFLELIEKFEQDPEILLLKFYLLLKNNKTDEIEKLVNNLNIKDPDSVLSQLVTIIFNLYKKNDYESSIKTLQQLNKNNKITVKMFNLIGVSLMSKGLFEEAAKALSLGREASEKNGIALKDYNSILVNLICCYRNLSKEEELRACEENLKRNDPKNGYFKRLTQFEEEFNIAIA